MGDYNPNAPAILGPEWTPIRQADYVPDGIVERGYITHIEHSVIPVSGAVAVNVIPPQSLQNTVEFVSIYKASNALNSGPARRVVIPAESISITGGKISSTTGDFTALTNPNDVQYVGWTINSVVGTDALGVNFDVNGTAATELSGKRILGVRLIYTASGEPADLGALQTLVVRRANTSLGHNYQTGLAGQTDLTLNTGYQYVDFGEYNPLWKDGVDSFTGMEIFPWRQSELLLFDSSAIISSRIMVMISGNTSDVANQPRIGYMALEVTYCEETRVLYGGRRSMASGFPQQTPGVGDNLVQLLNTSFQRNTTALAPDDYLVTVVHKPVSNYVAAKHPPTYAALRELVPAKSEFRTLPSIGLRQPQVIGEALTEFDVDTTTPVPLWTATTAITGAHPYADQIAGPVTSNFFVRQRINGRPTLTGTVPFHQIRFYARRYAGATTPLTVLDIATNVQTLVTVEQFDALPEIVDGWREVTVTLTSPVNVSGSGRATIHLISTQTVASGQWQILGARTKTNGVTERDMTYDGGNNAGISTDIVGAWKAPADGSTTDDVYADFMITLAQNPPIVSGFAITQSTLAVTGIGIECGVPNSCIPTGVGYNNLGWTPLGACDSFDAVTASGIDPLDTGQTWTIEAGFTGTSHEDGRYAVIAHGAVDNAFWATVNIGTPDADVTAKFATSATATGAAVTGAVFARFTDTNNFYNARVNFNTDNTFTVSLFKVVGGVVTTLATSGVIGNYAPNEFINVRLRVVGSMIFAFVWRDDMDMPIAQIILTDTSLTTGNRVGFRTRLEVGNTNTLPHTMYVDSFYAVPATQYGGRLQVDRMDAEDLVWQTVIDTKNLCITGAKDLEARVGVQNWYRARLANAGDFWGPWVSGTGTIPAPGVSGVVDANSILMFTSNRAPLATLAYVMAWQDRPVESFVFPEADTQILQRMYGRDFQVAFRPLERGGEQFDRTILVQAAAIPLESLANFTNLRDLAWSDLPYVCVRDELGNRWYANVLVPNANVSRNRRLYVAGIRVTDVTDTPAPII